MMLATGGRHHRGAIWALGLLGQRGGDVGGEGQSQAIADAAAALARLPDGFAPKSFSKGRRASRRWQVPSPRGSAVWFPAYHPLALPQLQHSRARGARPQAQLDALMAIMTSLERYLRAVALRYGGLRPCSKALGPAGGWRLRQFAGRAALARLTQSCWR